MSSIKLVASYERELKFMSDILTELEKEIANLESQFQNSLTATGNNALYREYSDIITVRQSLEVLKRKANKTPPASNIQASVGGNIIRMRNGAKKTVRITPTPTNGFVLSKAVKDVAKSFNADEVFSINEVWDKIKDQHPNHVKDDTRKRSASATLSNLTKDGELVRVKKGEGGEPTIYTVAPAQQGHYVTMLN